MANQSTISDSHSVSAPPEIRRITIADLKEALVLGWGDFKEWPSHAIFLVLIYPTVGLFAIGFAFGYNVLPLFFPLAAGYALIGPIAAIGLYELSRRREQGLDSHWTHAFDVFRSPQIGAIRVLCLGLAVIFLIWIATAQFIYAQIFGDVVPATLSDFARQIFATPEGWRMIIAGSGAGFLFAVLSLCYGVVSFPYLVDHHVDATTALQTSFKAVRANPFTMAAWGFIVAGLLLIGSLPLFVGLSVVLPILGHATWHLYRKVIDH